MSLSSTGSQSVKLTEEENGGPKFSVLSETTIRKKASQTVRFVNNYEENAVSPRGSESGLTATNHLGFLNRQFLNC